MPAVMSVTKHSHAPFDLDAVIAERPQWPGLKADGTAQALPQLTLNATRQEILDYFDNGWMLTEMLFSGLATEESYYRRPYHQLRHPMIFYYGHVVSVYINKLRVAGLLNQPLNDGFEKKFSKSVSMKCAGMICTKTTSRSGHRWKKCAPTARRPMR